MKEWKSAEGEKRAPAREFEDLHIVQQARALTNRIYALTRNPSFARDQSLRDQVRRAAVSIVSNIAEGFERGTARAFAQSLAVSKGSCGEVRAQLAVAVDQRYVDEKQYRELVSACRRLSAGLAKLIAYLKRRSAETKGQRGTAALRS